MSHGTIRLGVAGWTFAPWRGSFYPKGLPQKQELAYASAHLGAIEINGTFRNNPKPKDVLSWEAQAAGDGFMFPVKGPMFITHIKKLNDVGGPLANFFASGILALGPKLGPLVWQLPPSLTFNPERIESFLALLPHTGEAALALAGRHDDHLKSEPWLEAPGISVVRHAIEVRNESFANTEFIALLRQHNVALVTADTPDWPWRDATADFVYARLQGPPRPDAEGYGEADLDALAAQMTAWSSGDATGGPLLTEAATSTPRDVFAFFVHEDKLHAPDNARAVMARLGITRG